MTERDVEVLGWIGEQYGATVDQIRRLLGRRPGKPTKEAGLVTAVTAERRVKCWQALGLVEREKLFMNRPAWVWLTRQGLSLLEGEYRYLRPKLAMLEHTEQVNEVRLHIEGRQAVRGREMTWRSQRRLKNEWGREAVGKGRHMPDAEFVTGKGVVAVEVELTQKTARRIKPILIRLSHEYDAIWYFCNATTGSFINRQIAGLEKEELTRKFRVYRLGDYGLLN